MWNGASHTNRYFKSAGGPFASSGHTSTLRSCRLFSSYLTTMPPTLPEPEAVDQMMLGSTGSGVANPLSPPPIECHMPRGIWLPPPPPPRPPSLRRLLLGPRYD